MERFISGANVQPAFVPQSRGYGAAGAQRPTPKAFAHHSGQAEQAAQLPIWNAELKQNLRHSRDAVSVNSEGRLPPSFNYGAAGDSARNDNNRANNQLWRVG